MNHANGTSGLVRSIVGLAGGLALAGIIGSVVMYGDMKGLIAQVNAQEQHIEYLDRRIQVCENVLRNSYRSASREP